MANNNVDVKIGKILTWANEHGREFRGGEVADLLNTTSAAVGSLLSGMARRGELDSVQRDNKRYYVIPSGLPSLAETLAEKLPTEESANDLYDPTFLPTLKQSLIDRLAELHVERNKLDAQVQAIDNEAVRIRAACGVLDD